MAGAILVVVTSLLLVQIFATFAMTGLIWFVQLVHYPLFSLVSEPRHANYAKEHQRRTGWVVAPLMLVEVTSSSLFLSAKFRPHAIGMGAAIVGFSLVAVIWGATALVQVPIHSRLLASADNAAIGRLVRTNWVRTLAWTARSALLSVWLWRLCHPLP